MFMTETLRDTRVADFHQLFLWKKCASSWMGRLSALSLPTHHNISSLLFITKKQYEVISPMVPADSVAFKFCDIWSALPGKVYSFPV